jgi:RNA polymerase sigma-70 factor, ECF subfamily
VVRANRALALGLRDGPAAGLAAVEQVAHDPRLARSNLVPAVRGDLLRRAGRYTEAADSYRLALERNTSEPGRQFLRRRIAECSVSPAPSHRPL